MAAQAQPPTVSMWCEGPKDWRARIVWEEITPATVGWQRCRVYVEARTEDKLHRRVDREMKRVMRRVDSLNIEVQR